MFMFVRRAYFILLRTGLFGRVLQVDGNAMMSSLTAPVLSKVGLYVFVSKGGPCACPLVEGRKSRAGLPLIGDAACRAISGFF